MTTNWLDRSFVTSAIRYLGVLFPQRGQLEIVGAVVTDDEANDITRITISGGAASALSALDIDWRLSGVFTKTLATGTTTFTFSGATSGMCINVRLTGVAGSVVTWPAGTKFPGGVAPVQSAPGLDVYTFIYDGTNYLGVAVQAFA
jgi:hypothetical protein